MTVTLSSSASFGAWQPRYADLGIPTFPVAISPDRKKPMVSHYGKFGLPGSRVLARKYPDATAIGFMVGRRTGLTVLDVDSTSEVELADALNRHGKTPVVVRSGSGHHQAWYRHNGEGRLIRFEPDKPVDILGAGYVVAPPSQGIKGCYEFIEGGLDDLDRLPVMRGIATATLDVPYSTSDIHITASASDLPEGKSVSDGHRHKALVRHCLKSAHWCDDLVSLVDVARTRNEGYLPPMPDEEVMDIAKWAWNKTVTGDNWFGQTGARFSIAEIEGMAANPDAMYLLAFLRATQGKQARFIVANGLAYRFGWTVKRLAKARGYLEQNHMVKARMASLKNGPALYRWRGASPPPPPMSVSEIIQREQDRKAGGRGV